MKNSFLIYSVLTLFALGCSSDPCEDTTNIECATSDVDGDGILNPADIDPSDPCAPEADNLACPSGDFDGDGIMNGDDSSPMDPCKPNDNLACHTGDLDNDGTNNEDDSHPEDPCLPFDNLSCPMGDVDNDGIANNIDPNPLDQCLPDTPPFEKIIVGRWMWAVTSFEGVILIQEDGSYKDLTNELLPTGGNSTTKTWSVGDNNTLQLLLDNGGMNM